LHSGWAIAVSAALGSDGPVVIDRRRLELAPSDLSSQPYHHDAIRLSLAEGEALVLKVRSAVLDRARRSLQALRDDLAASFDVAGLALRSSRPLPGTLAEILTSRALYIADSEMYRDAIHDAARELGLRIFLHAKAGELEFAAQALNTTAGDVAQNVQAWRKTLGPPWQRDHRAAAAAALGALGGLSSGARWGR